MMLLTVDVMRSNGVREIYSFDEDSTVLKVSCDFHSINVPDFACAVKTRLGSWKLLVLSKWIWSLRLFVQI